MRNLRKSYQMYVLNLDAGRIFWITIIFILFVSLSFFMGLLVGKEKAKGEINEITSKNKVMMDEIIDKLDEKNKDEEKYQFYELISPEKVTDKNKEQKIAPEIKQVEKQVQPEQGKDQDITLNNPSTEEKISSLDKDHQGNITLGDTSDNKLSLKNPYVVQVASYKKAENAQVLKDYLISQQYPAYIIKSNINGVSYYRVRIGPFASKALCLKVIEMVRHKKECDNCFIIAFK